MVIGLNGRNLGFIVDIPKSEFSVVKPGSDESFLNACEGSPCFYMSANIRR